MGAMLFRRMPESIAGMARSYNGADRSLLTLRQRYNDALQSLSSEALKLLREWPARHKAVTDPVNEYQVRGKTIRIDNYTTSLSHQQIPKIAPPPYQGWGELLTFLQKENLPGSYPYTGGVYPYRRTGEDPIRMFAGEGTPERTNAASITSASASRPRACPPPSTASRCTARPRRARTSTARSATPASTSPRWTT